MKLCNNNTTDRKMAIATWPQNPVLSGVDVWQFKRQGFLPPSDPLRWQVTRVSQLERPAFDFRWRQLFVQQGHLCGSCSPLLVDA